eukprot:Cvel_20518.t1-p1 / transcript=Cvel_20518.t1 / gene=Cvel_20518 / organism=Chromera_velia_CCMP2878 / gene_product=hypothetical protein / transcript_product=hypothetical protein / location=Cvel_scaffold1847:30705-36074(+) / protein_length=1253 / sequence_SO=supercontig / SO=protein_coding / is_pseudo=false
MNSSWAKSLRTEPRTHIDVETGGRGGRPRSGTMGMSRVSRAQSYPSPISSSWQCPPVAEKRKEDSHDFSSDASCQWVTPESAILLSEKGGVPQPCGLHTARRALKRVTSVAEWLSLPLSVSCASSSSSSSAAAISNPISSGKSEERTQTGETPDSRDREKILPFPVPSLLHDQAESAIPKSPPSTNAQSIQRKSSRGAFCRTQEGDGNGQRRTGTQILQASHETERSRSQSQSWGPGKQNHPKGVQALKGGLTGMPGPPQHETHSLQFTRGRGIGPAPAPAFLLGERVQHEEDKPEESRQRHHPQVGGGKGEKKADSGGALASCRLRKVPPMTAGRSPYKVDRSSAPPGARVLPCPRPSSSSFSSFPLALTRQDPLRGAGEEGKARGLREGELNDETEKEGEGVSFKVSVCLPENQPQPLPVAVSPAENLEETGNSCVAVSSAENLEETGGNSCVAVSPAENLEETCNSWVAVSSAETETESAQRSRGACEGEGEGEGGRGELVLEPLSSSFSGAPSEVSSVIWLRTEKEKEREERGFASEHTQCVEKREKVEQEKKEREEVGSSAALLTAFSVSSSPPLSTSSACSHSCAPEGPLRPPTEAPLHWLAGAPSHVPTCGAAEGPGAFLRAVDSVSRSLRTWLLEEGDPDLTRLVGQFKEGGRGLSGSGSVRQLSGVPSFSRLRQRLRHPPDADADEEARSAAAVPLSASLPPHYPISRNVVRSDRKQQELGGKMPPRRSADSFPFGVCSGSVTGGDLDSLSDEKNHCRFVHHGGVSVDELNHGSLSVHGDFDSDLGGSFPFVSATAEEAGDPILPCRREEKEGHAERENDRTVVGKGQTSLGAPSRDRGREKIRMSAPSPSFLFTPARRVSDCTRDSSVSPVSGLSFDFTSSQRDTPTECRKTRQEEGRKGGEKDESGEEEEDEEGKEKGWTFLCESVHSRERRIEKSSGTAETDSNAAAATRGIRSSSRNRDEGETLHGREEKKDDGCLDIHERKNHSLPVFPFCAPPQQKSDLQSPSSTSHCPPDASSLRCAVPQPPPPAAAAGGTATARGLSVTQHRHGYRRSPSVSGSSSSLLRPTVASSSRSLTAARGGGSLSLSRTPSLPPAGGVGGLGGLRSKSTEAVSSRKADEIQRVLHSLQEDARLLGAALRAVREKEGVLAEQESALAEKEEVLQSLLLTVSAVAPASSPSPPPSSVGRGRRKPNLKGTAALRASDPGCVWPTDAGGKRIRKGGDAAKFRNGRGEREIEHTDH